MRCPICSHTKTSKIFSLPCGNFDGSIIYKTAKVVCCKKCGHIYNILTSKEASDLTRYYDLESAPVNLNSPDMVGDRTGSTGPLTLARYSHLFKALTHHMKKGSKILDAGSATGGFLDYLAEQGYKDLLGFDVSRNYSKAAMKQWGKKRIKVGNLEKKIPFTNSSIDLLVADQIVEHLLDIQKALKEAWRVLQEDGILCISVPDASRYRKNFFFDFFWFTLREHIQHFDIHHLSLLAQEAGFTLVEYSQYDTPMMNTKMVLPVLTAVFQKSNPQKGVINSKHFLLQKEMRRYEKMSTQKLLQRRKLFQKLAKEKRPVYAWGIGRESLYLYEAAGLKNCKIAGLIDQNPYKQKNYSIKGLRISDKSVVQNAPKDSTLIITAVAHDKPIREDLVKLGYKGKVISF